MALSTPSLHPTQSSVDAEINLMYSGFPMTLNTSNCLKAIMLNMSRAVKNAGNNSSLPRLISELICAELFPPEARTISTCNTQNNLTYPHRRCVIYGATQYVLYLTTTVKATNIPTLTHKAGRQFVTGRSALKFTVHDAPA